MPTYRAFLMEAGSTTIVRSHNFDAYDEREALERAARYVDGHDVELWEGEKLVKRFEAPSANAGGASVRWLGLATRIVPPRCRAVSGKTCTVSEFTHQIVN